MALRSLAPPRAPVGGPPAPRSGVSPRLPSMNLPAGGDIWNDRIHPNLPPFYRSPGPGQAGLPYLKWALENYDKIPGAEGRLAGNLERTEIDYAKAQAAARGASYGTGAQGGGVQRLARANLPVEKAGAQVGNLYEHETWKADTARDRLASLLFPYLGAYNQAYGGAAGIPLQSSLGSSASDWLKAAGSIVDSLNKSGWIGGNKSRREPEQIVHWSGNPQSVRD